ncbi:acetylxylan esterase [Occallatibacter savannae]|uniref:glucuronyl esterase domain-containing protein n=1 Tax=Occallatibacter savannae TaxID=1002691 RepID=UPI00194F5C91|nr:acetylxylan esterase [Occallatibacter savannae]
MIAGCVPGHGQMTAEQDRARLLGLLGLKESEMRARPDGNPKSPHATNYDLAKANVYTKLPDPLVFKDGTAVKNAEDWMRRKKEIRADFDKEILGRTPASLPEVKWQVVSTKEEKYGGVDVVTKRLAGQVGEGAGAVQIDLLLTTPAKTKGPVPVLMELAFENDFKRATSGPLEGYVPQPWGVDGKLVVQRGWGFAILNPVSVQKDDGSGLTSGIIGYVNHGKPRGVEDWGALKAWAWGAHEALRYFETDKAVDAKQVGLAGHSRFGKAVLVTMAYYPEFAIGYSSSSGEGGAKLYRHIYGETIANLCGPSLYHWFDGEFLRYGGPLNAGDLPVDNHELIALSAPRPLFIAGGSDAGDGYAEPNGDAWADTHGMFLAEVAAGPVYKLMGEKDLGTTEFPKIGTTVSSGALAFQQHEGGHLAEPSWPAFLEFAGRYLKTVK